jgi:uncharacterized protein YqeY
MSQGYHTNAKTNMHSREIIQQSDLKNTEKSRKIMGKIMGSANLKSWGKSWGQPT